MTTQHILAFGALGQLLMVIAASRGAHLDCQFRIGGKRLAALRTEDCGLIEVRFWAKEVEVLSGLMTNGIRMTVQLRDRNVCRLVMGVRA